MTHYGGGQLVVVGSKDRVVRLVDVVSQKEVLPAMHGHAGSIRAVLLCEERGLVFSAGYDLSIRSALGLQLSLGILDITTVILQK